MEKLINQTPYRITDFVEIASWNSAEISETLYFADNGNYFLHCVGGNASLSNAYGSKSFTNEDLIRLEEDDVRGWLKVHATQAYAELFEEEVCVKTA